jgi:lipopolysaccharide biosynthesis protein
MINLRLRARIKSSRACHLAHSLIGHLRRIGPRVRRTWPGGDPSSASNNYAVYSHYDRKGNVHEYVVEQIRQLAAAGYRVIFISNGRRLRGANVAAVRPFCWRVIWRRNVGYDFGAYKDGIAAIGDLNRCERLLLMNDSVYGPFRPMIDVLAAASSSESDFWGITDSWSGHYHIQSYFVLFFRKAIASRDFREFWRRLPYVNSKSWIIQNAEIRLTQKLTQQKLRAAVLCPYWDVAKAVLRKIEARQHGDLTESHEAFLINLHQNLQFGIPLNSSHFFWDTLITDFNCPFIKRELIQSNPQGIIYPWRWPEVIAPFRDYDASLISRHLQSM